MACFLYLKRSVHLTRRLLFEVGWNVLLHVNEHKSVAGAQLFNIFAGFLDSKIIDII